MPGGAQVAPGDGLPCIDGQGAFDQADGELRLSALARQHAQEVQGIEMLRRKFKQSAVTPFRLGQRATLVQGQGSLQQ